MKTSDKNPSRLVQPLILAVALLSVGVLAYKSGAQAGTPARIPTVVASVDLEKLVNDCNETIARNKANDEKYKSQLDTLNSLKNKFVNLSNELKTMPADSPARHGVLLERAEIDGILKVKKDVLDSALDPVKADVIRDVYKKALASIDAYAKQNGIALVIVDDSTLEVQDDGGFASVSSAIIRRRLLYVNKTQLDITNDILTKLNNDFAAGGKKK